MLSLDTLYQHPNVSATPRSAKGAIHVYLHAWSSQGGSIASVKSAVEAMFETLTLHQQNRTLEILGWHVHYQPRSGGTAADESTGG